MIKLISTDNMSVIVRILSHDDLWERFSDGVEFKDYTPSNGEQERWLLIYNDNDIVGVIYVYCESTCSIGFHPYMLKKYRRYGREMVKKFYKWFLENLPESYVKINVAIPECFKSTVNFALKVGFTQEGINRNSYKYNDTIYNKIALGITRGEINSWVV